MTDYAIKPMLPTHKTGRQMEAMIAGLFKQILLNDLIVDENSPADKDGFRMVFRHYQSWMVGEAGLDVSHLTVSESQGYGMMMMVYMAGKEASLGLAPEQWIYGCAGLQDYYNAMLRTVMYFPSTAGDDDNRLYAWTLTGYPRDGENRSGYIQADGYKRAPFVLPPRAGCATDGDMDIIYSLLLADARWGSGGRYDYMRIARGMLDSFWRYCVHPETHALLVGDWPGERGGAIVNATRPSDFIFSHLKAYAIADESHDWQAVITATYRVISDIRDTQTSLGHDNGFLPDFAERIGGRWRVPAGRVLEDAVTDATHAYNACRVPWRLATDYLLCGNTEFGAKNLYDYCIAPLDRFARGIGDPERFGPFHMDGSPIDDPDSQYELFTPPFLLVAAATGADQGWLDRLWDWDELCRYNGDNYADYIKFFVMLTASGNYWLPAHYQDGS